MNLQNKDGLVFSPHLIPANIRNGVIVLGVTGNYIGTPYKGETNIFPALEDQVLETAGKIVYTDIAVNKITPVCTDVNLNFNYASNIDIGGEKTYNTIENLTDSYYVRAKSAQAGWYNTETESDGANVFMISEEEQAKIIPENIAAGATILGVDGGFNQPIKFTGESGLPTFYSLICKIIKEVDFKDQNITLSNMQDFFSVFYALESVDFAKLDFSTVTTMTRLFYFCTALTNVNFNNITSTTATLTTASGMFYNCPAITTIDLSNLDFSAVTTLDTMFFNCRALQSVVLPKTQNVTNLDSVFLQCLNLENIDLTRFKTDNATNMFDMFASCFKLTTLDLSNFNTAKVTNMKQMFMQCYALANVTWGDNWASNAQITAFDVSYSPLSHDSCLDLLNKLATKTTTATLTLSSTTKALMSDDELAIATGKGWTIA